MLDLKNTRVNGKCSEGKNKYVSVTTILGVINKEALKFWFGREVFNAVTANPKLTLAEALKYPYKTLAAAAKRGTQIHDIVNGNDTFLGEHSGYIKGYKKFLEDYKPEIIDQEVTLFNDKYLFAGTYDIRCKMKGKIYILDIKTGSKVWPDYQLQISGYKLLCDSNSIPANKLAVVRLGEDEYEFKEFSYKKEEFLAALTLYKWQKENK